ncbi:DUF5063 domain-containing protein [Desulfatiferula olefinivorans]
MIEDFAKIAEQYCSWTEALKNDDEVDLNELLLLLSLLFNYALSLPITDPDELDEETERLTNGEWKSIHEKYSPIEFQYYNEIFDPHDFENSVPVVGDLHDDLADIYRDIKPGVLLYQKGFTSSAVFEWQSSFGFHWGEHILSAMRAIYMYMR